METTVQKIHRKFKTAVDMSCIDATRIKMYREAGLHALSKKAETMNEVLIKYPGNKMIYKKQVVEICNEFGLVIADLDDFIGTIPDKNLIELTQFRNKYLKHTVVQERLFMRDVEHVFPLYEEARKAAYKYDSEVNTNLNFFIVCPMKDVNESHKKIKKGVFVVDDPIILATPSDSWKIQYEGYGDEAHFIIVTAWGDEAQDQQVFNERHN